MARVTPAGLAVVQEESPYSSNVKPSLLCSHKTSKLTVISKISCRRLELKKKKNQLKKMHCKQLCRAVSIKEHKQTHKILQRLPYCYAQTCDPEQERQEVALTKIKTMDENMTITVSRLF